RALAKMFKQFKDKTSLVVLNACYSQTQAEAIAKYVYQVIATRTAVGDEAAIGFSAGFYQGLASGRGVTAAFELGCARMEMADKSMGDIMLLKKGSGRARFDLSFETSESSHPTPALSPSSKGPAARTPVGDQNQNDRPAGRTSMTDPSGRCFI